MTVNQSIMALQKLPVDREQRTRTKECGWNANTRATSDQTSKKQATSEQINDELANERRVSKWLSGLSHHFFFLWFVPNLLVSMSTPFETYMKLVFAMSFLCLVNLHLVRVFTSCQQLPCHRLHCHLQPREFERRAPKIIGFFSSSDFMGTSADDVVPQKVERSWNRLVEHWATRLSVCSHRSLIPLARTARFALLASLACSASLTHSLARSLSHFQPRGKC